MTQPTVEFASDAVALLGRAINRAVTVKSSAVGTEHLLYKLLDDNEKPGSALVPGFSASTSVSAHIMARDEQQWVHRDTAGPDHGDDADTAAGSDSGPDSGLDNTIAADAAWREALTLAVDRATRALTAAGTGWPEPTGALRACLLGALRLARQEGSYSVHERHLARALLDLPDSRAVEAMVLVRVDLAAAATALDAQADAVRAGAKPWTAEDEAESPVLKLLRMGGLLGERGTWWMRGLMSWMTRSAGDGAPILIVLRNEATRQALRCGRSTVEPVDLLLAVLSLDRALTVSGRALPDELTEANRAAELLRSCGVDHAALVRAAVAAEPAALPVLPHDVELSAEAERVMARTRLLAAERRADSVGTVHLLAVLLDGPDDAADGKADSKADSKAGGEDREDGEGPNAPAAPAVTVDSALRSSGADPAGLAALRAQLDRRPGV